ncbi:MAG: TonB-dependent receptor [Xanthobacteraceae bacterium]|nr:TonB-dependent receptor [Xanthobacteraceae bacterium]
MLRRVSRSSRGRSVRRWLLSSAAPLGLLAFLPLGAASPSQAQSQAQSSAQPAQQTTAQAERPAAELRRIRVQAPRRKPPRRGPSGTQPAAIALPAAPAADGPQGPRTPLNTNVIAEIGSRLGLTPRQIPATVEVIDKQTIQDRGLKTTTDVAEAMVGVTAGDAPGAPGAFSMRGQTFSQVNILYNGINLGPTGFTSRITDTANLEQVEVLKGPASLMSGLGAVGGAVNFVTRKPHTGPIQNEFYTSWDSFDGYRVAYGSGGSTNIKGLDYRFDITRSSNQSFIDDTYAKLFNVSGQINYQVTADFKVWIAAEYKQDRERFYWGTPVVPVAFAGANAQSGVVSGNWVSNYNGTNLGPVTVDNRTLRTTYNVLDNDSRADQLWLRGGFDWMITNNLRFKNQTYGFDAQRKWFNNEVNAFNATDNLVDRERFFVAHDQKLIGNISDLIFDSVIFGMENRATTTLAVSHLDFKPRQSTNFPFDQVTLVNPNRGLYGPNLFESLRTTVDSISLSLEDRLKITRNFALVGGVRVERIEFERFALRPGFPFGKSFDPVTGRIGYTWEALPGLTFYSQYATAADAAVATVFNISATRPQELTTARTYETGVRHLFWDNRAEWLLSLYDIERKNVYSPLGPRNLVDVAGTVRSKGVELSGAVRPTDQLKIWGNVAWTRAKFEDFSPANFDFNGKTPPNVPRFIANGGASYRFKTAWPVEVGASVRHVSDRYVWYDNAVTMLGYTTADAFVFVDIPKSYFMMVDQTRLAFRVRNITDKIYAILADPGYPDQVLLGAPRSYEVSAAFKF